MVEDIFQATGKLFLQALHYYNLNKFDQALNIVNEVLMEQPNDGEALYLRAECLNNTLHFQEALVACRDCIQSGCDPEKVNYLLSVIHMNLLDFENSEKYILETLNLNPQNASAMAVYSMVMIKTGNRKMADELMAKAVEMDPLCEKVIDYRKLREHGFSDNGSHNYGKLIDLGNYHFDRKQFNKAREYFLQAFLMQPNNQSLLDALSNTEEVLSPIYYPIRLFWYVHPGIVWCLFAITAYWLHYNDYYVSFAIVTTLYFGLLLYSHNVKRIYRLIQRKK
jgi:tetratricopeptide (TPR) repeat protein